MSLVYSYTLLTFILFFIFIPYLFGVILSLFVPFLAIFEVGMGFETFFFWSLLISTDNFHFVRFFCFLIFLVFAVILNLFGQFRAIMAVGLSS